MQLYSVFDDKFLQMAQAFINSLRYYNSDIKFTAYLPRSSQESIKFCEKQKINHIVHDFDKQNFTPKQISRLLKMACCEGVHPDEPVAYLDIDIIFQNNISQIEELNPNFIWVLSKREGHQTILRKWKKHYFVRHDVEFAKKSISLLDDSLCVEEVLNSPVRNCGVIYGKTSLVRELFIRAEHYYQKLLYINKEKKTFSDSDQLCFVLAFLKLKNNQMPIKELPIRFNRMPYHQSYDFKDKSCFFVPDNVVLHLNRNKISGKELIDSWSKNVKPHISLETNTRCSVIIPIQTSNIAERSLMKNLYSLAVSNKANVYRDEDIGYPIQKRVQELDKIRDQISTERPAYDNGLFFIVNDYLFMIDHGEHVGKRAQWIIGKYVNKDQLAGIFIEQMDKNLDISQSKIPIMPLSYGTKKPELWLNQGLYHNWGITNEKKYSVHFLGDYGTNKERQRQFKIMSSIPNSKIENRKKSKRLNFDDYIKDMTYAHIIWCPPGGRPKTHREVEAMCCEIATLMPKQDILEQEMELKSDYHYICIDSYSKVKDKVQYYLEHPVELAKIARNGRLWYEQNNSDYARAKYIFEKVLEIIV